MVNEYEIKKLNGWLENINGANNTLADIQDQYSSGIDYEDEDGEQEFTRSDMDDLFYLLCKLEKALKSEIKNEEESQQGLFFYAKFTQPIMREKASSVTKMSSVNCGQGLEWSSSNRKIAELCWRFFFYIFLFANFTCSLMRTIKYSFKEREETIMKTFFSFTTGVFIGTVAGMWLVCWMNQTDIETSRLLLHKGKLMDEFRKSESESEE